MTSTEPTLDDRCIRPAHEPCRWTAAPGRVCATHGVVQYRCFCCNKEWHHGTHDSAACMTSLGESYSILRDALEGLIEDRRTYEAAVKEWRMGIDEAKRMQRLAERT